MLKEIKISEFNTNIWRQFEKLHKTPEFEYDDDIDTLSFYLGNPGRDTVVTHYIDQNVALLFRNSDREIVGFCIEGFTRSFASKYAGSPGWRLSTSGFKIKGVRELRIGLGVEERTRIEEPAYFLNRDNKITIDQEFIFA